jgi:hypothetical protein
MLLSFARYSRCASAFCAAALAAALTAALAACGNDLAPKPPLEVQPAPIAKSVTLLQRDARMYVADTIRFTATVFDSANRAMQGAKISWTSSDTSVATIDSAGLVTGRQRGFIRITASLDTISAATTLTVSPIIPIALGDSVTFDGYYQGPAKVQLSLHAGDTLDLGAWVWGSNLTYPGIVWDSVASGGAMLAGAQDVGLENGLANSLNQTLRGRVQPALVAPVTGTYVFRVRTSVGSGPCNTIPGCELRTTVMTRRSAPVVPPLDARVTRGYAGDITIGVAHAPTWLTIEPAAATIHAKQRQRFLLRLSSPTPGVLPTDSIVFSGVPANLWNSPWHSAQISARLDEQDNPLGTDTDLVSVTLNPAGTLVAAGWPPQNVYTLDRSSGQTQLLGTGLEQKTSNVPRLAYGGDGGLYVAQPITESPLKTLFWHLNGAGTFESSATLGVTVQAFAVTADQVLYSSTTQRPDTIFWRSLRDSTASGTIAAGARPAQFQLGVVDAMVLSPTDHELYYTTPSSLSAPATALLHRLDPTTKRTVEVATVTGRLAAIDERGYFYTLATLSTTYSPWVAINVYDPTGRFLDTRWPSVDPYTIAVDRDWIYGIDLTQKRTIFRLPVKVY